MRSITKAERWALSVLAGVGLAAAVAAALLATGCRMNGCIEVSKGGALYIGGGIGPTSQEAGKEVLRGAKADVSPGGL